MKKRVLMGIVLLAIIGTSAVFAQQPTLDKLTFATSGGGYEARALNSQVSGAVVIPDTYNGKPVVSVSSFGRHPNITSVTFPNSLISIGSNAFELCTGLTSIVIPASVTSIGGGAFKGCTGLTSVTFSNIVTEIGISAFNGCTGLKSITIPASVTKIAADAFRNCTSLTSVTFMGTASVTLNNANDSNAQATFDGDLTIKYQAGGPGTYTRTTTGRGSIWTKQGGVALCPYCGQPLPAGFKAP